MAIERQQGDLRSVKHSNVHSVHVAEAWLQMSILDDCIVKIEQYQELQSGPVYSLQHLYTPLNITVLALQELCHSRIVHIIDLRIR